jgi:hypothetical protein
MPSAANAKNAVSAKLADARRQLMQVPTISIDQAATKAMLAAFRRCA